MQFFAFSALAGSLYPGASMESVLRWEMLVRWMDWALPTLYDGATMIVFFWVTVLLPMSVFRKLHPLIAKALGMSALLVGLVCWWQAFIVTYRLLGWLSAATGLLFAGVGVIPLALMATWERRDRFVFGNLCATAGLTIAARLIAKGIRNRDARKKATAGDLRYYAHK